MFRVGTSFIFCSINARSSSVTLNLICTVRFLPSMRSRSFPFFRGFGTLPNKQFSTDARQCRRAKIRKGYPFPMLAKKLFPLSLLRKKPQFCQTYAKEKRCNLQRLQRFLKSIFNFAEHSYSSSFSTSAISFAVAVTIRSPVSLIPSSSASSCRRCVFFSAGLSERNWSTDIL